MIKLIIYFLLLNVSCFSIVRIGDGIGDMDIEVSVIAENKTKKYYIGENLVLDSGIYNPETRSVPEQKIATILVIMQAKKSQTEDVTSNTANGCIIDSEFSIPYNLNKLLTNELEAEILLSDVKNYYNGENLSFTLKEKNFKRNKIEITNGVLGDDSFTFTAYPNECSSAQPVIGTNLVSRLEYQFEIWLSIDEIRNGAIIGSEILVKRDLTEMAIGTVEDLIKGHFTKMQTF